MRHASAICQQYITYHGISDCLLCKVSTQELVHLDLLVLILLVVLKEPAKKHGEGMRQPDMCLLSRDYRLTAVTRHETRLRPSVQIGSACTTDRA